MAMIADSPLRRPVQIGGYLRGRAKTLVALRDGAPSASVLGWQSSRLPTEHMPWPMSCRTAALNPVRGK